MATQKTRRYSFLILLILLVVVAFPMIHLLRTKWRETDNHRVLPARHVDDASALNLTSVDTIIAIPKDRSAIENQLRHILHYANTKGLKNSVGGSPSQHGRAYDVSRWYSDQYASLQSHAA